MPDGRGTLSRDPARGSGHVPFLEGRQIASASWNYASDIVRLNLAVIAGKAGLARVKP